MNAYELADELQKMFVGEEYDRLIHEIPDVLRQQADRIERLEKLLEHSVGSDCREMRYIQEIENKDARIAELEKKSKPVAWMMKYRNKKISLSFDKFQLEEDNTNYFNIPLYTTPQTKPLSDGVILNSIQHPRNDGYVPEELNSDSLEMVEIDLPCVLTIDEIHNLFGITALNPTVTLTWEQCEKIARAIEERHGIK